MFDFFFGIESRFLARIDEKMGGALAIHITPNGEGSLLWGHTTQSISIGYMKTTDARPKVCKILNFYYITHVF